MMCLLWVFTVANLHDYFFPQIPSDIPCRERLQLADFVCTSRRMVADAGVSGLETGCSGRLKLGVSGSETGRSRP